MKKSKSTASAMSERMELLEAHLASSPSPFSDAVLPNAFHETPDVPSIHAEARKRCLSLIREARDRGRTSLQVITGEAGDGKTHLIAWLRRQSEEAWRKNTASGRFALTVIPPLRSVTRVRHHVLQEVVRQLSCRLPGDVHIDERTDTPIEIVIWRSLLAIGKILAHDRSTTAALKSRLEEICATNPDRYLSSCVEHLKQAWPKIGRTFVDTALRNSELAQLDREVFRVLARFPEGEEAERTAIVDWLGGASLSTERLEALDTNLVLDEEAEATRGLRTLLTLANLASTPVALAFDQIEGTARLGDDAVKAFLETVAELYNDCSSTVLFVFCQAQLWPELRERAPNHVRDRLDDMDPVNLKALTPNEALLLVEARMRHFWQGVVAGPEDPLFPFHREQVESIVGREKLRTPRAVVKYFQALLREPPERRETFVPHAVRPSDQIRRKLDVLLDDERRTARPPDMRAALAQSVLHELLAHAAKSRRLVNGVLVRDVQTHRARKMAAAEGVRVTLERSGQKKRVYVESSNKQHGNSIAATIKRLAGVLKEDQADVAVLLREEAFPLTRAANDALIELTPRGVMLRLAEGEVPQLAAIEALLNAAAAGDVPVDRATALDLAVEHIDASFDLGNRLVACAFPDAPSKQAATATPAPAKLQAPDEVAGAPPLDPRVLEAQTQAVLTHLRTVRAFEPAAHLASALGVSVEAIHEVLHQLEAKDLIELVDDRSRSRVVLLRPEGVL
ncbi:MAG TPA: hypothetical protein VM580_20650 [Labilithrix sp.]|nr:hypothetical protein [Labilithrix sp.]